MVSGPRLAAASFVALIGVAVAAQSPRAQTGAPPAVPQQPSQTRPIFRGQVDVIQLDVSVLDKDRKPVRGLGPADFTVLENGKPQRIVAVSEIDALEHDPPPTSWMRHVPRDVANNDLVDELGDGRLFAIVLDDWNTPNDLGIVEAMRQVGRYVVNSLGPSDMAAVVYVHKAGKTVDFTSDRDRLLSGINSFDPDDLHIVPRFGMTPGPGGGDMPQRYSPVLSWSTCDRTQPAVPTLWTVVDRLAAVQKKRKTLIFLSPGVPLDLGATDRCPGVLASEMKDVFRKAQRSTVNIYGIDPTGFLGFENYLMDRMIQGRTPMLAASRGANNAARTRHDFLEIMADYTGARAITDAEVMGPEIDRIFEEDSSYYIVGYQTSNAKPDGKFRRVSVKVNRPGVTVRTRSGYWGAKNANADSVEQAETPATTADLNLNGLMNTPGLPLRASVVPVAAASEGGTARTMTVAIVLTVREPRPRELSAETLTVITNLYDADGRPGPPVRRVEPVVIEPGVTDEVRYDLFSRLNLAPGRYQLRLNTHSTRLDASGSVYADVDVPDITRAPLTLSGIVLGTAPLDTAARDDGLGDLLPVVPTSAREFSSSDRVTGLLRLFQGSAAPIAAVRVHVQIFDSDDVSHLDVTADVAAEAFAASRAADYSLDVPLTALRHGPHLLTITATVPGGAPVRRDLVFRVR